LASPVGESQILRNGFLKNSHHFFCVRSLRKKNE
jgi:hypothetical protein